jgi:hypothetical protein
LVVCGVGRVVIDGCIAFESNVTDARREGSLDEHPTVREQDLAPAREVVGKFAAHIRNRLRIVLVGERLSRCPALFLGHTHSVSREDQ